MKRIIIIGGGFAGVACAKRLTSRLKRGEAEVVLFSRENHMVFSPLLADCVGSSLDPSDVMASLRQMLPGVLCRTEEVYSIDLEKKQVTYEDWDGAEAALPYDHVIISSGNVADLNSVPGMADHAYPLKTVGDAAELRSHVLRQLEKAEVCSDPARRRWFLSFVVVGGGYSGVEVAGEINDLVRSSRRYYSWLPENEINVTVVHSRDQILPEISSSLRDFALEKMKKHGIKFILNARAAMATPEGVGLKDGSFLEAGTVVCTVGTSPAPFVQKLKAEADKGKILTAPDMRLKGFDSAWACGDCALVPNAHDGQPSPPTGQFAMRQGAQLADNVVRVLRGDATKPFSFRCLGQLCSIGGHKAVAEMLGFKLSGFWAWFVWRGVYLFKLPTWSRRIKVGADWAWLLLFPRDLAHERASTTERVSHAHYEPGDWIFHQGDAADAFYVIEKGEVEIIREGQDGAQTIALLGPGNFFGEQALIDRSARTKAVRARGPVEVIVMGPQVFRRISGALEPLRQAIAQAKVRRGYLSSDSVLDAIATLPIAQVMEPTPPLVPPTTPLHAIARLFETGDWESLFISEENGPLLGIITLTDLVKAHGKQLPGTAACEHVMTRNPSAVTLKDTAIAAFNTMRELNIKSLPVIDPANGHAIGILRARKLMGRVIGDATSSTLKPNS